MFQSLGKSDRVWLKDRKGHQISLETCFRRILCNKEYLLFVFCTHIHFASSIYFNCRISSITVAIHFSGSMLNSGGVPPETYEKNVFGMSGSHSLQQFLRQETVEAQDPKYISGACTADLRTSKRWTEFESHLGMALHYTPLHYNYNYTTTQLHSTTLHYTKLHYTILHYSTLHYTTLHYTPLHYTTLHSTTLHYIPLHYTNYNYNYNYNTTCTLRYTTLH